VISVNYLVLIAVFLLNQFFKPLKINRIPWGMKLIDAQLNRCPGNSLEAKIEFK